MITRAELVVSAGKIAPYLDQTLATVHGERTGFVLFLFDFASRKPDGDKGSVAYISNAEREDVIALLKEITGYLEAGLTTEAPGPRGTS